MVSYARSFVERVVRSAAWATGMYPARSSGHYHLRELLHRLDITCVLDVGAHHGEYARNLRRLSGYRGRVISFEPSGAAFHVLCQTMAHDPAWIGKPWALGRVDGIAQMHRYALTVLNSLHRPSAYGAERMGAQMDECGVETVTIRRLDSIFDDLIGEIPNGAVMLKVDTQGSDLDVLEGAEACLDRIVALQTEVPVKALYEGAAKLTDTLERLSDLGYEITGLFPVIRDKDELSVVEFDCMMRRVCGPA